MNHEAISAGARQFHRHSTQFRARLEPHPDHADQFRLSFSGFTDDLAVIDVSAGGLALRSGFLVPRNMRFAIVVSGVTGPDGREIGDLTVRVIVRRCVMLDHKPSYQIGLQFLDSTGRDEQTLVQATTEPVGGAAPRAKEPAGVA